MKCFVPFVAILFAIPFFTFAADKPLNVVLVITDDQGYGDVGFHGNEMIQTPHLDSLAKESLRFTNFHVDPTCAETRSALMTGRYSSRVGVWHTIMGRSLLRADEITMADMFAGSGYRTGMFGKWHLGDNYPFRTFDRGFHETFNHGGGGVGQTPDFWGNDYFGDTYYRNGKPEPAEGYCTDIWFDEGLEFIKRNKDKPFFCYIATNAPHGPYYVARKYAEPYEKKGVPQPMANFYGMITNIDENVGKLNKALEEWGLADNTIVIFMTDNGTAAGVSRGRSPAPEIKAWRGYNAGMRGQKGSQYEGGHRVPCFVRAPNGMFGKPRAIDTLVAHIDLLPTLMNVCELRSPHPVKFDGMSLASLFEPKADWGDRTLFVHSQRVEKPEKWRKCSVMTEQYRLVDGKELYDIKADPGQETDIAAKNETIVRDLRRDYEAWWDDISPRFDEYCRIELGAKENPARLTCHDWHAGNVPWNQNHIKSGTMSNGYWAVNIAEAGDYEITLRRWDQGVEGTLEATTARCTVGEFDESKELPQGAESVTFKAALKAGPAKLQGYLTNSAGKTRGAYYAFVKKM